MRTTIAVVLSFALLVCSSGCHGNSASPAGQGTTAGPADPAIEAAFSPEAEKGGTVATPLDPRTLSPTELQFGRSPKPDPNVTYQPDVLIMEHGDTALRSMESNGLVWHFDANAPQVDQIAEGKLIFATERCVGRVMHIQRTGDDIAVVLGPVQLTDIIQKAHLVYDQPVDLNSIVVVPAPDLPLSIQKQTPASGSPSPSPSGSPSETPSASPSPGEMPSASPTVSPDASPSAMTTGEVTRHFRLVSMTYSIITKSGAWKPFRTVSYDKFGRPHQQYRRTMAERVAQAAPPSLPGGQSVVGGITTGVSAPPASIGMPPNIGINGSVPAVPTISDSGWGLQLTYDSGGIKVIASATLFIHDPHLRVNLPIENGIKRFGIDFYGAGGFEAKATVTTDKSFRSNIKIRGDIPYPITIPLVGPGLIGVHFIQNLEFSSGVSARESVLEGSAKLEVCCRLGVAYNGKWDAQGPQAVGTTTANVNGISVGINDMYFGLRQEILLGVGFDGLAAGPYVALDTGITALKQSSIAGPNLYGPAVGSCRQATLNMDMDAGVGWTLPGVIVKIINGFLSIFRAKPIPPSGTFVKLSPALPLIEYKGSLPAHCAG